jgi:CRISPR-associated endoribonuclease Cas6
MTTLYSSVIKLQACFGGQLARDPGQWANAAFYGILHQVDPTLAEGLHQWNGRKPFTVSSLGGLPRGDGQLIELRAGWECWLRVTTLGETIFQTFIQRFIQGGARPQLQLGPLAFAVAEVLTTPGAHPWSGYAEATQLRAGAEPAARLTLEFASPTGFNLGSAPGSLHYELFPHPRLVFGSLATKWRACISPDLEVDYVEDLAAETRVSDYRLQTQTLKWKGRVQKGFTGRCTYDLRQLAADEQRLLAALADFAFYAGAGGKTTQGMGQCRRVVG